MLLFFLFNLTRASDVDVDKPDEKSIMTYVAQFLMHHPDSAETDSIRNEEEVQYVHSVHLQPFSRFVSLCDKVHVATCDSAPQFGVFLVLFMYRSSQYN